MTKEEYLKWIKILNIAELIFQIFFSIKKNKIFLCNYFKVFKLYQNRAKLTSSTQITVLNMSSFNTLE